MRLSRTVFSKPAKYAALMATGFLLAGLVLDGEYRRLFSVGQFFLIFYAAGMIAEWWRPTRSSADTQ